MKKLIFVLVLSLPAIYFVACSKNDTPVVPPCTNVMPSADSSALLKFAADSIQPLTRDTTGLYYHIVDTGTGAKVVPTSLLTVTYTGKLMTGSVFDTANNAALNYPLYQLIPGWQVGLPKIREGGHIKLLIPSALAYGCQGAGSNGASVIPPNSPIYFDIYLIRVN